MLHLKMSTISNLLGLLLDYITTLLESKISLHLLTVSSL